MPQDAASAPGNRRPTMSNPVLLNHVEHRDLRVDARRGAAFGDDVMYAPAVPAEFRSLQAHYPIVFQRDAAGGFHPLALLGLRQGENLFRMTSGNIAGSRWGMRGVEDLGGGLKGVFVLEGASVIIQVASFKLTGKRVFKMAPLHHHFELMGWQEPKVITRFLVLAIMFALASLTTLKLR